MEGEVGVQEGFTILDNYSCYVATPIMIVLMATPVMATLTGTSIDVP